MMMMMMYWSFINQMICHDRLMTNITKKHRLKRRRDACFGMRVFSLIFKSETVDVLEFLLGFTAETDYTVWSKISSGLGSIKVLLAGDAEAYAYLKTFIRKLYGEVCATVGWEKKEGEPHTDSLKRALVLKAMSAADDEDTAKTAARRSVQLSILFSVLS